MIGIESIFFNYSIVFTQVIILFAMIPITKRSFQENYEYKWNNLSILIILSVITIFFIIPINNNYIISYPWSFFSFFWNGFWLLLLLIFTLIVKRKNIEKPDYSDIEKREMKRKVFHGLTIIYAIVFILTPLLNLLTYVVPPSLLASEEYIINLNENMFVMDPYAISLSIMIFVFTESFYVQITTEILRINWPNTNFLLRKTLIDTSLEKEEHSFATHIHFIPNFCLGAILFFVFAPTPSLAANALVCMMTIAIFGDMMAAIIGIKFGKHKWRFFPEKSIEGTLAGVITSLLVSIPFLGPIPAIVGATIFILTDLVFPKFGSLTDNMLNPLLISIAFVILFQIPGAVMPLISVPLFGVGIADKGAINHQPTTAFLSSFAFFLLISAVIVIIALIFIIKYKKDKLKLLLLGKKSE
jgi:dolichol kinase